LALFQEIEDGLVIVFLQQHSLGGTESRCEKNWKNKKRKKKKIKKCRGAKEVKSEEAVVFEVGLRLTQSAKGQGG